MTYSNCLGEFNYLFFNLEDYDEVAIYACYRRNKAQGGTILLKDVKEDVMVGCIVCFDKVNECYMGW